MIPPMIFYFSATGNSKYAAERIAAATDDHLIFLRDAVRSRSYRYDVSREQRIGFVVPTYFYGLPSILTFFLEKLQLSGYRDQYVYLVLTCGGSTGNAAGQMAKLLKKKDIALSAQFGVRMVDNYVPLGQIADEASAARSWIWRSSPLTTPAGPSGPRALAITTASAGWRRSCSPPWLTLSTPMAGPPGPLW